jgi:hypothetical protein
MGTEDLQRIGEILIEEGTVLAEEVARAAEEKRHSPILEALQGAGLASRQDLSRFLAAAYQIPHVSIASLSISDDVIAAIPRDLAAKHEVVPVERAGGILFVAKANFFNRAAVSDVRKATGLKVKVVVAPELEVHGALKKYYGITPDAAGIEVAAPVTGAPPVDLPFRSTGVTKKYTAPPGRTAAALSTHDRISMLFTEDWAPPKRNGHGPTQPMKAIPVSREEFALAERSLHIDHIRQWERYYTAAEALPAVKMSR